MANTEEGLKGNTNLPGVAPTECTSQNSPLLSKGALTARLALDLQREEKMQTFSCMLGQLLVTSGLGVSKSLAGCRLDWGAVVIDETRLGGTIPNVSSEYQIFFFLTSLSSNT